MNPVNKIMEAYTNHLLWPASVRKAKFKEVVEEVLREHEESLLAPIASKIDKLGNGFFGVNDVNHR